MSDLAICVDHLSKMYRIGVDDRQPQNLWQAARSLAALERVSRYCKDLTLFHLPSFVAFAIRI